MTRTLTHVAIAGAALVLSAGALAWWQGEVRSLAAEAAAIRAELAEQGTGATRLAEQELARNETQIYSRFVNEADIVTYLEELESTGDVLGAVVDVDSVEEPQGAEAADHIVLTLIVRGSFDSVVRTLGAIEHQPYDTRLTTLTLDSPEGERGWAATATFRVGTGPQP